MAAGGASAASHSIGWDLFFIDLEQLVLDYEQLKASNFTTNYSLDETLLERFENAVQALRNVLPHACPSFTFSCCYITCNTVYLVGYIPAQQYRFPWLLPVLLSTSVIFLLHKYFCVPHSLHLSDLSQQLTCSVYPPS